MSAADIMQCNRVILAHYDSYSAALLFARWDERSLLWPEALPESAAVMPAPDDIGAAHDGEAVRQAIVEAQGGAFRHLTQLRGAAMSELLLLREVFNLIVGGRGGRG